MKKNISQYSILQLLSSIITVVVAILFVPKLYAHHGFATHYDINKPVKLEGILTNIKLRNPHSEITIQIEDETGKEILWHCETQAKSILTRKGVTTDLLPVGEKVVIEGSAARREPNHCEIGTLSVIGGATYTFRSTEGRANIQINTHTETLKRQSIFGLWLRDSFNGAPMDIPTLDNINEAGREINQQYQAFRDDPTNRCSPVNPMRAWITPGSPTEISRENDYVIIQHEFMDTTRKIKLIDPQQLSNELFGNAPASLMGTSLGYFSEDGTLIVETKRFTAGVLITQFKNSGVLHSPDLTMRERFSVDTESGQLLYRWEARDAQYFPVAITGQLSLSPTKLEIEPYNCQSN
jgi:hypothetical protein